MLINANSEFLFSFWWEHGPTSINTQVCKSDSEEICFRRKFVGMKEEILEMLTPEFQKPFIEKWKFFEGKCEEIFLGKL